MEKADDPEFMEIVPKLSAFPLHMFLFKGWQMLEAHGVHYTEFVQASTLWIAVTQGEKCPYGVL